MEYHGPSRYVEKATEVRPSSPLKMEEVRYDYPEPIYTPSERRSSWESIAASVSIDPYEQAYDVPEKPPEKKTESNQGDSW